MNIKPILIVVSLVFVSDCVMVQFEPTPSATHSGQQSAHKQEYETRAIHDPDGTGKFYMGREIAQVMGHEAAAWLERRERLKTETPDEVVRHRNRLVGRDRLDGKSGRRSRKGVRSSRR